MKGENVMNKMTGKPSIDKPWMQYYPQEEQEKQQTS